MGSRDTGEACQGDFVNLTMMNDKTLSLFRNYKCVGQEGASVYTEAAGESRNSRPVVECDSEADLLGGKTAWISEVRRQKLYLCFWHSLTKMKFQNVLGEEDPRVDRVPEGGSPHRLVHERPLLPRRLRPQRLRRRDVVHMRHSRSGMGREVRLRENKVSKCFSTSLSIFHKSFS